MTEPATFEHLFRPLVIGPVELPNRIVSTSHQTTLVADHLATDDLVAYHEARARNLALRSATGRTIRFANVFAPEIGTTIEAEALIVSLGRTPDDRLASELGRAGVPFVEAGDCRSPWGLEEAILEGTLAARPVRV